MNITYTIETNARHDGKIISDTYREHNDGREMILRQVTDTREEQIRKALVSLGWTPPGREKTAQTYVFGGPVETFSERQLRDGIGTLCGELLDGAIEGTSEHALNTLIVELRRRYDGRPSMPPPAPPLPAPDLMRQNIDTPERFNIAVGEVKRCASTGDPWNHRNGLFAYALPALEYAVHQIQIDGTEIARFRSRCIAAETKLRNIRAAVEA